MKSPISRQSDEVSTSFCKRRTLLALYKNRGMLNVENQCEIGHANPHFTFTFVNLLTIAKFFFYIYSDINPW